MDECPNKKVFDSLSSTFDRLEEAAWFIRLMEEHYHSADRFRWSLSSLLLVCEERMTKQALDDGQAHTAAFYLIS
ncbi:MAG: hypothetical protein ACE37D_16670, partial [Pseudomonadales bacterium]